MLTKITNFGKNKRNRSAIFFGGGAFHFMINLSKSDLINVLVFEYSIKLAIK